MSSPTDLPPALQIDLMDGDPHVEFARWFRDARERQVHEPEAMALATSSPDGHPSVRMVLLRGYGPDGYVWFTNGDSRKGRQLARSPYAALVAHWATIGRQVRIEGPVVRAPEGVSDEYFAGRDRQSQLGAWASQQSEQLEHRDVLLARLADAAERFGDGVIPRPPHWGGWMLHPDRMEFWQHGENRLHDRVEYVRDGTRWSRHLLNP